MAMKAVLRKIMILCQSGTGVCVMGGDSFGVVAGKEGENKNPLISWTIQEIRGPLWCYCWKVLMMLSRVEQWTLQPSPEECSAIAIRS